MKHNAYLLGLVVVSFSMTGYQVASAQMITDWPVEHATAQQTRFADIFCGGPPVGILWRDPYSVAWPDFPDFVVKNISPPVLSDGVLIYSATYSSLGTLLGDGTAIRDAETGECLYTFPEVVTAAHAVGKVDGETRLFRCCKLDPDVSMVTITAWNLDPLIQRTGNAPILRWARELNGAGALARHLTYFDGALYVNSGFLAKLDGRSGNPFWSDIPVSPGTVAIGDAGPMDEGTRRRIVVTPTAGLTALDDAYPGQVLWNYAPADVRQVIDPTLIEGPDGSYRVVAPFDFLGPKTKGKSQLVAGLLCLDAANGDEMWRRTLKANCIAGNGPVAVRYQYGESQDITNVTIFDTPGSGQASETDHPLYAFDLYGDDAWPANLPNPIMLPSGTISEPAATQDRVFLPLGDGTLFSVDLASGEQSVVQFDLYPFPLPLVAGSLAGPIVYGRSRRLGFVALATEETHNLSLTAFKVPESVQGEQSVPLSITVENIGNFPENGIEVTLDIRDGTHTPVVQTFESQSFQAKESRTFSLDWTPARESTEYMMLITAAVEQLSDEVGICDNTMSRCVTVLPGDVVTIRPGTYWSWLKKRLHVEATSSSPGQAVLKVYYPDRLSDATPAQMKYSSATGLYTYDGSESTYYDTVCIESSLGGSATSSVGQHR